MCRMHDRKFRGGPRLRAAFRVGAVVPAVAAFALSAAGALGASWHDGSRTWYYETVSGGAAVSGSSPVASNVAIPSRVGGLAVVAVAAGAFLDADGVGSVSFPSTLRTIGEGAFFGCDGLRAVTLPASVASVGDWAFSHCSSLESFSVASGSAAYSASGGVLYSADGSTLVRWPGGKSGACEVPDGVSRIAAGAFCGADKVSSVSLPESLSGIGDRAFAHCGALASFSVAPGNGAFEVSSSEEALGALVTKDGKTLVCVPAAAAATAAYAVVPPGVETVAPSAMAGLSGLSSVSLPDSVARIGGGAFLGCTALLAVDSDAMSGSRGPGATSSVAEIGDEAFLWCLSMVEAPAGGMTARVGSRAFAGCSALQALELGAGVESVESSAFTGCPKLSSVRLHGDAPDAAALAVDCFDGSPSSLAVVVDDADSWPGTLPGSGSQKRSVVGDPGLSPVFRFWSKGYKAHFYTISVSEKDSIVANDPNWKIEGTAYFAEPSPGGATVPLYRFYSKKYRGHFFTVDLDEKRDVLRANPNWKYEGIAFRVFPESGTGLMPVHRFWSKSYSHHFYTMDSDEAQRVIDTDPHWKYEGIGFYAAVSASALESDAPPATDSSLEPDSSLGAAAALESVSAPKSVLSPAPAFSFGNDQAGGVCEAAGSAAEAAGSGVVVVPAAGAAAAVLVQTVFDAPSAPELSESAETAAILDPPVELLVSAPVPVSRLQLWRADAGVIEDRSPAPGEEAGLRLGIAAAGVWHWLRVFDEAGGSAASVWFRVVADGDMSGPPCSISLQLR